jgi:periplasmic protein TonB
LSKDSFSVFIKDKSYILTSNGDLTLKENDVSGEVNNTSGDSLEEVLRKVEVMPEFPGGDKAMLKFVCDNLHYPVSARDKGIQGKIYVNFVISETGKVQNVKVIRGVHPLLDKEACRVVQSLPDWIPGRQDGKRVKVLFTIPINFAIN